MLIGNTLAILCVQTMVALYTRHRLPWRIEPRQLDPRLALAMLRYGVNDLRLFFDNDLRFLGQFR